MDEEIEVQEVKPRSRFTRKRVASVLIAVLGVSVVGVASLPYIIAGTSLRDVVVNGAIDNRDVRASTSGASFGWFSSLRLSDLEIVRSDESLRVNVEQIEVEKSWLRLWLSLPNLGNVVIDRPQIDIVLSDASQKKKAPLKANFKAVVRDAHVSVRTQSDAEPVIDLDGLNLTVQIERDPTGRMLSIEPVKVFDHQKLTPELCDHGLQLIAPILSDSTSLEGTVSFDLNRFRLPLEADDPAQKSQFIDIDGRLKLHDVTAGLKSPLLQKIAEAMSTFLKVDVPKTFQVVNDTELAFHVRDGRVFHDGLTFILPELSSELEFRTSGSVGLDESLDLVVQIPFPLTLIHDGPLARRLSDHPLKLKVAGTLKQPELSWPERNQWAANLAQSILPSGETDEENPLVGALFKFAEGLLKRPDSTEPRDAGQESPIASLLERIRERRAERANRATPENSEPLASDEPMPRRRGLFGRRGNRQQPLDP